MKVTVSVSVVGLVISPSSVVPLHTALPTPGVSNVAAFADHVYFGLGPGPASHSYFPFTALALQPLFAYAPVYFLATFRVFTHRPNATAASFFVVSSSTFNLASVFPAGSSTQLAYVPICLHSWCSFYPEIFAFFFFFVELWAFLCDFPLEDTPDTATRKRAFHEGFAFPVHKQPVTPAVAPFGDESFDFGSPCTGTFDHDEAFYDDTCHFVSP